MTLLDERFPELAALPRVPIVERVTAVQRASHLSELTGREIWVKRDDATSDAYGGNKVRKLAYLLGDAAARRSDVVITTGALGSHHVLATSIFGERYQFEVHGVLSPQPWNAHVEENLRAELAVRAHLHRVPSALLAPAGMAFHAARLRASGKMPYVIPHGGSTPVGALGYVEAGLELAQQIDTRVLPEPDAIYLALGSGATAVGLAIGLAAAGLTTPIIAVLVTSRLIGNPLHLRAMTHATVAKLRALEPRFPDVTELAFSRLVVDTSMLGVGYGNETQDTRRVTELAAADDLVLDPTYTAPTLLTLMQHAEAGRWDRPLYWHTLSSADLGPLLRRSKAAPAWARNFAGAAR